MKAIALALLIANLILAGWWLSANDSNSDNAAMHSEANPEVLSCYTVNIYEADELEVLSDAIDKLSGTMQVNEFDQWKDGDKWWVVSASDTTASLNDYRSVVSGAFEVTTGPKVGQYSLGIFSSEANALTLQRELGAAGLKSEMLLYQLREPAWRVIISAPQVEWLINRYQFEFIEKKSC
ncbi:hypothetical protein [uncultured Umboniibacter sp.]|uniref:hypothetical protein n=1 Tax=uncultured Umboniibacter sp. TaxID=1798917 RepID=UPI002608E19C|nr:hypothetical protein [uncultured Umboniibacter sp.]